MAKSIEV